MLKSILTFLLKWLIIPSLVIVAVLSTIYLLGDYLINNPVLTRKIILYFVPLTIAWLFALGFSLLFKLWFVSFKIPDTRDFMASLHSQSEWYSYSPVENSSLIKEYLEKLERGFHLLSTAEVNTINYQAERGMIKQLRILLEKAYSSSIEGAAALFFMVSLLVIVSSILLFLGEASFLTLINCIIEGNCS